ncbi:Maf family nucleotide pyrophosphatase [Moheibacter lacus]|uniref:dTTP/UTP pyrophosphatase n=1 Tax=Moheibacter lacus TaxID=2745851 RepID=A0A838ZN98_9FLAO|nr:Maf family nucleotide pyrophosphatase [Moheibacter lacus]MBA5629390.1 septum formation protein Maf [Moheibacter lacus]
MLHEKFKNKNILLGSQSPRRLELLKGLGLEFSVVKIESDETYPHDLVREEITEHISKNKAEAYINLQPNEVLITADTLVWLDNLVLGKPVDEEDAFQMIQRMAGKTHEVFTSVTLKSTEKNITFSETTQVHLDEFTHEEIRYYIQNFKPFDKAGAYGIQDWLGYAKISNINGCYYNVMGLPLRKLYRELIEF